MTAVTAAEVAALRARLDSLEADNRALRGRLELRTGASAGQVQQKQVSRPGPEPWERDPLHHPEVVRLVMAGAPDTEVNEAIAEAQREIQARRDETRPASPGEIQARERAARDAGMADLQAVGRGMMPMPRGTTSVSISPSGQRTVQYSETACPSGHARRDPADKFCRVCGGQFADADGHRAAEDARLGLAKPHQEQTLWGPDGPG
jgi:hypothetical protein